MGVVVDNFVVAVDDSVVIVDTVGFVDSCFRIHYDSVEVVDTVGLWNKLIIWIEILFD